MIAQGWPTEPEPNPPEGNHRSHDSCYRRSINKSSYSSDVFFQRSFSVSFFLPAFRTKDYAPKKGESVSNKHCKAPSRRNIISKSYVFQFKAVRLICFLSSTITIFIFKRQKFEGHVLFYAKGWRGRNILRRKTWKDKARYSKHPATSFRLNRRIAE